ncbi:cadherin 17 [Tepidicaulis marinus]|jgi:hypothetical protein|uniref:Cadherin 17 n=1 Tax=Tepidicaulis marinus TaxID=1333998 RepID=A0A081BFP4_9HYPH|nr:hypothetical protein [Tepidicaulis marinus]GAK46862.1 cadherin 17 [Tepidicaulis marinus]
MSLNDPAKVTIELTRETRGIRIQVQEDGVLHCDELTDDWAHAFRECIHAFLNGLKQAEETMFTRHQREGRAPAQSGRQTIAATR